MHHTHTGSFENEDPFAAVEHSYYLKMPLRNYILRFKIFLIGYPFYLLGFRNKRHTHIIYESHFLTCSRLFTKKDKPWVIIGSLCCLGCLLFYISLGIILGIKFAVNFLIMPYLVFIIWLSFVTYLHHTFPTVPIYRKKAWNNLRGALASIDHDYGFFSKIHHHINLHMAHHLFPRIPHYHLEKVTESIKPVLGKHYRKSPYSPLKSFIISYKICHYVDDEGDVVFYKSNRSENLYLKQSDVT